MPRINYCRLCSDLCAKLLTKSRLNKSQRPLRRDHPLQPQAIKRMQGTHSPCGCLAWKKSLNFRVRKIKVKLKFWLYPY